ncbi:MAG: DEAD/DEAH box helicase [Candidatus Dadabacteria bacterium]|nr:MAG: DEAD/DEAH box helicase [Candidatus Dadabacteria bacterium]
MPLSDSASREKIENYLKTVAPYSVIEKGIKAATDGLVSECSRSANRVVGAVLESEAESQSVTLEIISAKDIKARCSCSTAEEMDEQWCRHAVAVLWQASTLGFFDHHSGFASGESIYRINTSSPEEIAAVINQISKAEYLTSFRASKSPDVKITLDLTSDRLGVRVYFDSELQLPALFEGYENVSDRALDTVLLQMLEEEGSWDEDARIWYVNSSSGIEMVLGLIQEYRKVVSAQNRKKISFAKQPLKARMLVEWLEGAVEIAMKWVLPDGTERDKETPLLGTGPYWTAIDNTIYRLSPSAARIASVFPHGSRVRFTRSQLAPILEVLRDDLFNRDLIEIINPELQPEARIKKPRPVLTLERREELSEHFASHSTLELSAVLDFDYPAPSDNSNIVYLPDREREAEFKEHLLAIGFHYRTERKRYYLSGDAALDIVSEPEKFFPSPWKLQGLAAIKKGLRFASLALNIAIDSEQKKKGETPGKIDWFDCRISLTQNNANIPISTLFKHSKGEEERHWIKLDSGAYAKVPGGSLAQLKATLGLVEPNFRLSNTVNTRLNTAQAIGLSRLHDESFNISVDRRLKNLSLKLQEFSSIQKQKIPRGFKGKLRSYQEEGLSWLCFLNEFSLGGILADEMGLGKTVQTLVLLQKLKESRKKDFKLDKPALVVAPTSVITNWMYEARRFTPGLKTLLLHGPERKKKFKEINNHDLVITSYALLRIDRFELERYQFSYVILDEAQNIKNPAAATTKAAKALKARHRLALTGTPTENRPLELWSIMDFLMPGYLGSREFFKSNIEKPIIEKGPAVQATRLLNAKTRPFILRRTKAEVEKDLPPKIESDLHVPMTESQRELYSSILAEVRPKIFEAVEKKGVRGASVSILSALLRLRQVCNHPNSIAALKHEAGFDSGKFELLKELCTEALENGRKILLFSQFIEMLSIIRGWLDQQDLPYLYLDGSTKRRQDIVDQFNQDPTIRLFLISLKAGGTGLNLTAADTVIIYDPWWNPAVEYQAVDRAHRIGQTRAVSVYRLITEDSIEQKIMDLKGRKEKIVDALINDNGLSTINLSREDLEQLFSPLDVK